MLSEKFPAKWLNFISQKIVQANKKIGTKLKQKDNERLCANQLTSYFGSAISAV